MKFKKRVKAPKVKCARWVVFVVLFASISTGPLFSGQAKASDVPMLLTVRNQLGEPPPSFVRSSFFPFLVQWGYVFSVDRELGSDIRRSSVKQWLRNIRTLPEIPDGDGWVINFIGHPLMGAGFYVYYKEAGFSGKQSFLGAALQSTLFEFTVEAWKQPPSAVDLVVTPVVGSLMGSKLGYNRTIVLGSMFSIGRYFLGIF